MKKWIKYTLIGVVSIAAIDLGRQAFSARNLTKDGPVLVNEASQKSDEFIRNFLKGAITSCKDPVFSKAFQGVCTDEILTNIRTQVNAKFGERANTTSLIQDTVQYKKAFGWPSYWTLVFSVNSPYSNDKNARESFTWIKKDMGNLELVEFKILSQTIR